MKLVDQILNEIGTAEKKYGNFNSTHEAYAVLKEEVEEVWEIIKENTERTYGLPEYKIKKLIPELIQVASVAIRIVNELENNKIKHI